MTNEELDRRAVGFPIMSIRYGKRWGTIPFSVLEPHREQAMRNHYQTLERLMERGGLSSDEALAVILDTDYRKMWPHGSPDDRDARLAWDEANWKRLQEIATAPPAARVAAAVECLEEGE